jgi:hypothetical protein
MSAPPAKWFEYDLDGRRAKRDREQIRAYLGFRPIDVADEKRLCRWLEMKVAPRDLTEEGDGKAAAGREPMRDLKEAGVQNRHLSESEPSVRRTGEGEVPTTTEARFSPRNPWT